MFLEYYGLAEQPFGVTPDPRFLYLGSKHREALAALDHGLRSNRGFLALIAKPGMGKTSLLFQYLESLRDEARTAFLFQTNCDPRGFMQYLLADLGLDGTGKDLPEMHTILNRILVEETRAGRRFVLVIDEAQNLNDETLESIRLMSNFETPSKKLMHIVIAGEPRLAERLAKASQLQQRISFTIRIEPFTREEVNAYIEHRLSVAGYQGAPLFTEGARLFIAEHSEGIPRKINNVCFNAMSLGCALKQRTIDRDLVWEIVAADFNLKAPAFPAKSILPQPAAMAAAIGAARTQSPNTAMPAPIANIYSAAQTSKPTPVAETSPIPQLVPQENGAGSVSSVGPKHSWQLPPEVSPGAKAPWMFASAALRAFFGSNKVPAAAAVAGLLMGAAAIGAWNHGQGRRLPTQLQPATNPPQNEAGSSVLPQSLLVTESTRLNPEEPDTTLVSRPASAGPAPVSKPSLAPPAPLPVVSRNNLEIEKPKTPLLKAALSTSIPSEAIPVISGAVNGLGDPKTADNLLANLGTTTTPPPPNATVGGRLRSAQLISAEPPVYPAEARAQRVQGIVTVDALVDNTGKVADAIAITGPAPLRSAAIESVRKSTYQPARLNDTPIQVHIKVQVRFSLN
jgi:general secretion pathway protein A